MQPMLLLKLLYPSVVVPVFRAFPKKKEGGECVKNQEQEKQQ